MRENRNGIIYPMMTVLKRGLRASKYQPLAFKIKTRRRTLAAWMPRNSIPSVVCAS